MRLTASVADLRKNSVKSAKQGILLSSDKEKLMFKRVVLILVMTFGVLAYVAFAQTAHYRRHGPALLNDPKITPGKVDPKVTKAITCATHWGTDERHVTPKMKDAVCRVYGLKPHCYGVDTNEIDHLISRELAGADDPENLWPQPYNQHPGAHEKDAVENWLHKQVCAGNISLAEAQAEIATDWYAVYLRKNLEADR